MLLRIVSQVLTSDTELHVDEVPATLLADLAAPAHVLAEIYTSSRREKVFIIAADQDSRTLTVVRGVKDTATQAWPPETCMCLVEVIPGACVDPRVDPCLSPWQALTVRPELAYEPAVPRLGITPTGVAPGNYGGAVVNQFGQFTYIPPQWPASALPVFDPCGCLDQIIGGEDNQTAAEVPFSPTAGNIVTGNNVQVAIDQLDAALQSISATVSGGFGVIGITTTPPITLGGTTANPAIGHAVSGLTPGVYAGFTVDAWGHITNYTPVVAPQVVVAGVTPIVVTFNPAPIPAGTYTVSVNMASITAPGVVQLVDPADVLNNTVPPSAYGHAVTWDALLTWYNSQISPTLPQPNQIRLHAAASVAFSGLSLIILTQVNIASVTPIAGAMEVVMSSAPSGSYQVVATVRNDAASVMWIEYVSGTMFRIHYTLAGLNPAIGIDFHVVAHS